MISVLVVTCNGRVEAMVNGVLDSSLVLKSALASATVGRNVSGSVFRVRVGVRIPMLQWLE